MKLHGYWRSSASYRVRIALACKGLEVEHVAVHLVKDGGRQLTPEFRAMNPMAQVPVLEIERSQHDRICLGRSFYNHGELVVNSQRLGVALQTRVPQHLPADVEPAEVQHTFTLPMHDRTSIVESNEVADTSPRRLRGACSDDERHCDPGEPH